MNLSCLACLDDFPDMRRVRLSNTSLASQLCDSCWDTIPNWYTAEHLEVYLFGTCGWCLVEARREAHTLNMLALSALK